MTYSGLSAHVDLDSRPDPTGKFTLQHVIGEGTYGEVYAALDNSNGKPVAIKIMENIPDNLEEIEEEYLILRDFCLHPNIPMFHGLYLKRGKVAEEDQLWFVMELCSGGSVTELVMALLKRDEKLSELQIAYILKSTVMAAAYLHANHCMHRDIKGHNILLTDQADVKLVDYGVSSHLVATLGRRNTSVGTPYWMAPEVIACEQQLDYSYDVRCDVWSLGITAVELADGDPPLSDIHPMRALFQIPRKPPPGLKDPSQWSAKFNDFVATCLVKDFEMRPFMRQLLEHPFLKDIDGLEHQAKRELKKELGKLSSDGEVVKREAEVTMKQGKLRTVKRMGPDPVVVQDLAMLECLTEDVIIDALETRFRKGQIYTYIGDILLAMNPFMELDIYNDQVSQRYQGRIQKASEPPHIFAIANSSYFALIHEQHSQCVVISGESGAGKTESANLLLKQLVHLGRGQNKNLEEKILQVNPIMEAFGNARTGINDNSSRFGKYVDLTFTPSGNVVGAKVSVYLLEQSRVVHQDSNERNFHIFYYLYDGLEAENKLGNYHLDPLWKTSHNYLQGYSSARHTVEASVRKWLAVQESFRLLGFSPGQVDCVNRLLAAILHIGDLSIQTAPSRDFADSGCCITNPALISIIGELLGVSPMDTLEAITTSNVVTRGETIHRRLSCHEARDTCHATAKALYGRLVDWLVLQMNQLLVLSSNIGHQQRDQQHLSIGILDIFGFENFPNNSFEQLCINIANEQIQYYFNQHVFSWEQQEYLSEGINVDLVEFTDNRPVLDMFLSKPLGLLALLDEESRFPNATPRSLVGKFNHNVRSRYFIKSKSEDLQFSIHHYAGKVQYNGRNFLEKNRNFLPPEVIHLLRQSKLEVIRYLFQCPLARTGNLFALGQHNQVQGKYTPGGSSGNAEDFHMIGLEMPKFGSSSSMSALASQTRAQQTMATYFRYSLMDLLQKMVAGAPHFVRCIKPNDARSRAVFDRAKVRAQLQYTGVLETVQIRKQGFSHRIPHDVFLKRYGFLGFGWSEVILADKENSARLLTRLNFRGFAMGETKVFLKYYHMEQLAAMFDSMVAKVVLIQACVRRWLAKRVFSRRLREHQMILAAKKAAQEKGNLQKAATKIQAVFRGYRTRKSTKELKKSPEKKIKKQKKPQQPAEPNYQEFLSKVFGIVQHPEAAAPTPSPPPPVADGVPFRTTLQSFQFYESEYSNFSSYVRDSGNAVNAALKATNSPKVGGDFALKPLPSSYNRPKGFDYLPQVLQESGQQKRKARSPPQMRPAVKIPASEKAVRVANQSDKPARKVARAAVSMEPAAKTPEPKTPPPKKQQQQHQLPEEDSKQQNLMTPIRPAKWVLQDTKDRRASEDRKLGPRGMSGPGIFSQNPHQQQRQPQAVPLKTIANEDDDELMGPYDFRKLLRKTNIAPTESLKLRKGLINPKTSVFPVTSNSWSANESVLRSDLRARLQPVAKI